MTRIILLGFMGAGKTTLGRALARQLGLSFIDLDSYIEQRRCKTIAQIFEEQGEQRFREIERNMLHEAAEMEDIVLSCGGGTPCFFDNMQYLNEQGLTVYLKASDQVLFTRLSQAKAKRPLLRDKSDQELMQYIRDALSGREPFYTRAHATFRADQLEDKRQISESVNRFVEQMNLKPH